MAGRSSQGASCTGTWSAAIVLGVIALGTGLTPGGAQERPAGPPSALGASTLPGPAIRIDVAGVVIGAPASETTLGINLGRTSAVPANAFVRIRGLSPQMSLTEGHVIAPGAWAVPVAAVPDLRVIIPAGAGGRNEVSVALVTVDGAVLGEAKTTLVVAAAALPQTAPPPSAPKSDETLPPRILVPRPSSPTASASPETAAPAPEPAPRPRQPEVSQPPQPQPDAAPPQAARPSPTPRETPNAEQRKRAESLLARGRSLLDAGDIASARLFLRRAADDGLPEAALMLGATYDTTELLRLKAVGIKPDDAEARRWYEKARQLGAGALADQRLERLGGR